MTQPAFVHVETVYMIWCDDCGKVGESRYEDVANERAEEHSKERRHG